MENYESRIKELIKKYHSSENLLGYYIGSLPEITKKLGNSDKVLECMISTLEELPPLIYLAHIAAAYRSATQETNERRKDKDIAKLFGISSGELLRGIKSLQRLKDKT